MSDPVFETEHYEVVAAPEQLPVRFNDAGDVTYTVDGYYVVSKKTGQRDGEFRSLAEASVVAYQWSEQLNQLRTATSKIERVVPNIPNEALQ